MTQTDQDELLVVVDKNDKVINYMPRKLVHDQKLLHRTISISVYNNKGQILMQKRTSKMDNNPNKWSNAAGGHVTKGKEYDEVAKKEIAEELGINPPLALIKKMFINDPVHNTMTSIYKARSEGPFNLNKEEIDEIRFFSQQDLKTIEDQLTGSAKIVLRLQGLL